MIKAEVDDTIQQVDNTIQQQGQKLGKFIDGPKELLARITACFA